MTTRKFHGLPLRARFRKLLAWLEASASAPWDRDTLLVALGRCLDEARALDADGRMAAGLPGLAGLAGAAAEAEAGVAAEAEALLASLRVEALQAGSPLAAPRLAGSPPGTEATGSLVVSGVVSGAASGVTSTGHQDHRLILGLSRILGVEAAEWDLRSPPDRDERPPALPLAVYCEDLRSPFNVGSIFRTAEAFGFSLVILSPLCPQPGQSPRLGRSAMGTDQRIPWVVATLDQWLAGDGPEELRRGGLAGGGGSAVSAGLAGGAGVVARGGRAGGADGDPGPCPVLALELGGTALGDYAFPAWGVVVLGSEEWGTSPEALTRAQESAGVVSIPLRGSKASINVGVSFGILANAWSGAVAGRSPGG